MDKYTKVVKAWKSFQINSVAKLEQHLENFRILFAYHSGKIENDEINYHDTREIFERGRVSSFTGDPRTLFEQQNQKICYNVLKEKIIAKEPISLELIRETHHMLTNGTYDERRYINNGERPGEFKKHDYVTGRYEIGSPAEEVEADLAELIQEVNSSHTQQYLKAATYFHANFESIHPFADGNGRVGRTLTNYYLMIHDFPPFIVYEQDRKFYYEALEVFDTQENLDPLFQFFQYETEKTWENTLRLMEKNNIPENELDTDEELEL